MYNDEGETWGTFKSFDRCSLFLELFLDNFFSVLHFNW